MLQVSQKFKEAMVAPVREFKAQADVHINQSQVGEVTTFSHEDYIKTIEIQRVGDNSKFFGFGICQRLNMHIVDMEDSHAPIAGTTIKVRLGVVLEDGTTEYISYPAFTITERNRIEDEGELSITAYDKLNDASIHLINELYLEPPYTIKTVVERAATVLGLGIAYVNIPADDFAFNLSYADGGNFEGTENLRDVLNAAAEATQTIYYIDENENLTFKRLDVSGAPVALITENDYFTFTHKDNRRLDEVWHVTELGDNVMAAGGTISSKQYVRNNPFWEMRTDDIQTVVDNALANVNGLVVSQFDCEWRGNLPLEIGDKIQVKQLCLDGCIEPAFVFDDVITFDGGYGQKTQWVYSESNAETDATPTSVGEAISQTIAKVDKVNKEITLMASKIDENTTNIGQIVIDTEAITSSVSSLTTLVEEGQAANSESIRTLEEKVETTMTKDDFTIEVQNILSDGVERVETTTGYVFDEAGLTISRSDSEISTQITEDGMTVSRGGEVVLAANNEGVKAEDLHATTFLIIGDSARFEEFEEDGELRVGCFWIGG